ncbi:S66 family peptidase [Clostridium sp.]|uniref:S66 family peptidase n=1 Tax=Clostridium sp. TaxID=1506 RepID=UPI003F2C4529
MPLLKKGDYIGIISCSNGIDKKNENQINHLKETLISLGLIPIFADTIYKEFSIFSGSAEKRGKELMKLFTNKDIKAIFDISGGDVSNGVLDYLDFEVIKENKKPFFGYSDLSVLLNALYTKTNIPTYHYQLRNLIGSYKDKQIKEFKNTFLNNSNELLKFNYDFIKGYSFNGIVVGGNIRCLLKLAGTEYMPSFKDKILFLESMSGDVAKMATYLTQYKQLGIFNEINGLLLGTFTEMERENYSPSIVDLVKEITKEYNFPIVKTCDIGHSYNSKCLIIGSSIFLE